MTGFGALHAASLIAAIVVVIIAGLTLKTCRARPVSLVPCAPESFIARWWASAYGARGDETWRRLRLAAVCARCGRAHSIDSHESLMSRRHANLIRSIFHDPPSGNVHWRDVESLLKHVGASLEPISGARVRVKLNRMEDVLHRPHHSNVLDTGSLTHLREFLARAGVTPSLYEAKRAE